MSEKEKQVTENIADGVRQLEETDKAYLAGWIDGKIAAKKKDRDCENCKHKKPDGCTQWNCNFEERE